MFLVRYIATLTGCGPESFKKTVEDDYAGDNDDTEVLGYGSHESNLDDHRQATATSHQSSSFSTSTAATAAANAGGASDSDDWDADFEDWEPGAMRDFFLVSCLPFPLSHSRFHRSFQSSLSKRVPEFTYIVNFFSSPKG